MANLSDLKRLTDTLPGREILMPVLFIGHGSPMNGIEDNEFSLKWAETAKKIPLPSAVLVVSAHWFTRGTFITAMDFPSTIHDFGGFPKALFEVEYPAPGNPNLAAETAALVKGAQIHLDHDWGWTMGPGQLFGICTRKPGFRYFN